MGAFSVTVTGADRVRRRLSTLSRAVAGKATDTALLAAALVPMNAAKRKAPYLTGNLRRSIHVGGSGDGLEQPTDGTDIGKAGKHTVKVGTNVVYAKPQEYGSANRPARPFLRPALDENKREMQREFADALEDALRAAMR